MKKLLAILLASAVGLAASPGVDFVSVLTYNVNGNGAADWSTNSPHVQAIGREVVYLQPDIITFQEIPFTNTWQMANFVAAFLPGYALATNSGADGYTRSVILSRFPIARSKSWMARTNLSAFGYNGLFTRDLFEAEIIVPGFPQPLHVFTAHLKSGTTADNGLRRGAEALAISNFFAAVFLPTNLAPYVLTGDMNEDIARTAGALALPRLTNAAMDLRLTTPVNPATGSELTISSSSPFRRYDYILPCGLLFSNIAAAEVFRAALLTNLPPNLFTNDDKTASDHLPVLMVFNNPYQNPFRLVSITRSNQSLALQWEAVPGQSYRVESSMDLAGWTAVADHLLATNGSFILTTNSAIGSRFFRVRRLP